MADAETEQPKAVQKIHEALGVRLFTPPPEGFDPVEASGRELLVHGFPARPDEQAHPELHEYWKQMMSRPMSTIQPQFDVPPHQVRGPRRSVGQPSGTGWSGSAVVPADRDTFEFVAGQWTVPHVIDAGLGQDTYRCGIWVGIDGYCNALYGSSDILQAGTAHDIRGPYGTTSYAWFEWYPANPCPPRISNLPVSPGDVMVCAICVHSPTEAGVYMANLTARVFTSFIKTAPTVINDHPVEVQLYGDSAQWILEAPQFTNGGDHAYLPQYGEIFFDYCIAGTRDHALFLGGDGERLTLYDTNGQPISTPEFVTDRLIKIKYTA